MISVSCICYLSPVINQLWNQLYLQPICIALRFFSPEISMWNLEKNESVWSGASPVSSRFCSTEKLCIGYSSLQWIEGLLELCMEAQNLSKIMAQKNYVLVIAYLQSHTPVNWNLDFLVRAYVANPTRSPYKIPLCDPFETSDFKRIYGKIGFSDYTRSYSFSD